MEFLKALNAGWFGSLIGLIGLVIAFLLYRASRVSSRPVYQYQALRLIGREEQALPEEVTVLFRDKKVERLTKTFIVLWNSGRATVNGESIVADDSLRLEFSEDAEVLSARILNFTRQANNFTVNINPRCPNRVTCSFAYLDAGDGVAIELLHTDGKRYPKVQGSIRGIPKGILDWGRITPLSNYKFMIIFMFLSGIFFIVSAFFGSIELKPFILLMGLLYFSGGSLIIWIRRRRFPKSLSIEDTE